MHDDAATVGISLDHLSSAAGAKSFTQPRSANWVEVKIKAEKEPLHFRCSHLAVNLRIGSIALLSSRLSVLSGPIKMLRTGFSRSAFRALSSASSVTRTSFNAGQNAPRYTSKLCTMSKSRPMALRLPSSMALTRSFADEKPAGLASIDQKHEKEIAKEKLEVHPETVSTASSTHPVFGEVGAEEPEKDTDMMAGIRGDLVSAAPINAENTAEQHAENDSRDLLPQGCAPRSL